MLVETGVVLVGGAYLLFGVARHTCRHRPESIWASEAMVLAVVAPAIMIMLATGGACLAVSLVNGTWNDIGGPEGALLVVLVLLMAALPRLAATRLRTAHNTPA